MIVHPEHRRRGFGTAALRALLPGFRARGRRTVEGWSVVEGSPGDRWAKSLGFTAVRSIARLGLDFGAADRALWEVAPPAGYRLARWIGTAPDELVASYARARAAIHDAPSGDTEFRQPEWTPERVRAVEGEYRERHVEHRVVVALSGDDVAGLTEVVRPSYVPDECYQGDTAVLGAHRGRRIGRWLKGEMARWLVTATPALRRITTATEGDNHHMIRVNRELGFRTLRTELVLAQGIAALDQASRRGSGANS